jgi:hypothetical protein
VCASPIPKCENAQHGCRNRNTNERCRRPPAAPHARVAIGKFPGQQDISERRRDARSVDQPAQASGVGTAIETTDDNAAIILKRADRALDRAKRDGKKSRRRRRSADSSYFLLGSSRFTQPARV